MKSIRRSPFEWLMAVGAISSTIALLIFLFEPENQWRATVALGAVVLFLLATYIKLYQVLNDYLTAKYPEGYSTISCFVRYSTADGQHIVYETFRNVQCKRITMNEFDHGFQWSGTQDPKISSKMQEIRGVVKAPPNEYDRLKLGFRRTLLYNDTEVIHVAMDLNDYDSKSSPHVDIKVEHPLRLIHWRIELRYFSEDYAQPAEILRKPIAPEAPTDYAVIDQVQFNKASKSFEYSLSDPEPGYYYRLKWNRP